MGLEHNGYAIPVYNGLLTPEHRERIGAAIWVYLWLLDKQTDADGNVLGGREIKAKEIDLGLHINMIRRHLKTLADKEYITLCHTRYGFTVVVLKPKKFKSRVTQKCESEPIQSYTKVLPSQHKSVGLTTQKCGSDYLINNNTHDNTHDTKRARAETDFSDEFEEFWEAYPRRMEKQRAYACWKARLKDGIAVSDMIAAAKNYAKFCQVNGTALKFMKQPGTFIGCNVPYQDWITPPAELMEKGNTNGRDTRHNTRPRTLSGDAYDAQIRAFALEFDAKE